MTELESANCCIHSAKIERFGYGTNYRIKLSELKPNVNLGVDYMGSFQPGLNFNPFN